MCSPVSVCALVCSCVYSKASLSHPGSLIFQILTTTCSAIITFLYVHPEFHPFNIQVNTNIYIYAYIFTQQWHILHDAGNSGMPCLYYWLHFSEEP